jgi:hypothetical protein
MPWATTRVAPTQNDNVTHVGATLVVALNGNVNVI